MGFQDLLRPINNTSASAALPDLISHEDWQLVQMEAKMWPKDAAKWSVRNHPRFGRDSSMASTTLESSQSTWRLPYNAHPQ